MVIVDMRFEVVSQIADTRSQQRYLDFRGTGISGSGGILIDDLGFVFGH
jgi:hypothetical protein